MKLRVIAALLVLVLLAALIPAPVSAASSDDRGETIKKQIRTLYSKCLRGSGRPSFHGYCGSLVSWQLYYMGVDRSRHGGNGNELFDYYKDRTVTCGGYKVKAYPATEYSMRMALDAITANGTMDAYNIMLGFQKTNTAAGQKYGHALLIHAILGDTVYFMESFDCAAPGSRVPQGKPVVCTVEEFLEFYEDWTTFEGAILFGLKAFTPLCEEYSASMSVLTLEDIDIYQQPFDEKTFQNKPVLMEIEKGQRLIVNGLYQTPAGKNWYQVEINDQLGYVDPASVTGIVSFAHELDVSGLELPSVHNRGEKLELTGSVSGGNWGVDNVTVRFCDMDGNVVRENVVPGCGTQLEIRECLEKAIDSDPIPSGYYRVHITAELSIYEVVDGELVPTTVTLELKNGNINMRNIPHASRQALESRENFIHWLGA